MSQIKDKYPNCTVVLSVASKEAFNKWIKLFCKGYSVEEIINEDLIKLARKRRLKICGLSKGRRYYTVIVNKYSEYTVIYGQVTVHPESTINYISKYRSMWKSMSY